MPPMVSIIIPALNEEKIIARTLASLSCLEGEFEIIFVDGGSRDRTRDLTGARPEGMDWIYYPKSFKLRRKRTAAR